MADGPLTGLRVIELAEHVSGPYCGKLLADLGAGVIKVEPPAGDPARRREPFLGDTPGVERSGLFLYLNTNKLGVTLDVAQSEGREALLDLLDRADALVENLGPATTEALGLDYTTLSARLPRLVLTSISPYGQTGPRRFWQGTELTLWNASGYGALTPAGVRGDEDRPLHPQASQAGFMAGANAAGATLAALLERERSGRGQQVDISVQETLIAALAPQFADYFYENRSVWTRDAPRLNIMQFIPCKDGYVSMLITQPDQWDRLVAWMGNPEWAQIGEYRGVQGMIQNWDLISFMFTQTFADRTKEELFAEAQARRIPLAPVNSIPEIVNSEHLHERDFFATVSYRAAGMLRMPGAPYRLSATPWHIGRPAPRLGEHNQAILTGMLGYAAERVRKLSEAGIV